MTQTSPRIQRLVRIVALLAGVLAGCGEEPRLRASEGVVHLDLRLEDGSNPTEVLDRPREPERVWSAFKPARLDEQLAPWKISGVKSRKGHAGGAVALTRDPEAPRGIELCLVDPGALPEFNAIELVGEFRGPQRAWAGWKLGTEQHAVQEVGIQGSGRTVLRFEFGENQAWDQARAARFCIWLTGRDRKSLRLQEVRLLRVGLMRSSRPALPERGDQGIVLLGAQGRRAWPTAVDVPLYSSAIVPDGGELHAEFAVVGAGRSASETYTAQIDARVEGAPWRSVARIEVKGDRTHRWRKLRGAVAELAGRRAELRFRAWRGEGDGLGGELNSTSCLWAVPRIMGLRREDQRPDIVLVTLDTLRVDALGCYGGPDETPYLDSLAARGVRFDQAWCAANSTVPSHLSLLTGLDVPAHGGFSNRHQLADGVRTLAESLHDQGYECSAVVSVGHLSPLRSETGHGFDRFRVGDTATALDGSVSADQAREWLSEWSDSRSGPRFLWLHLFDPHTPYGATPSFRKTYEASMVAEGGEVPPRNVDPPSLVTGELKNDRSFLGGVTNVDYAHHLYRAGVAYTDTLLQRALEPLESSGQLDRSVVFVTADHGENLGERGLYFNHAGLYEPVLHVPLMMLLPDGPRGTVCDALVRNHDIANTLQGYLGLEDFSPGGSSLIDVAREPELAADRRVFFMHSSRIQVGSRSRFDHSILTLEDRKLVARGLQMRAGDVEYFDLEADEDCTDDLADTDAELAEQVRAGLRSWLAAMSTAEARRGELSQAEEAELQALGYTGGDED